MPIMGSLLTTSGLIYYFFAQMFVPNLHIHPYSACVSSGGSGETVCLCRLVSGLLLANAITTKISRELVGPCEQ